MDCRVKPGITDKKLFLNKPLRVIQTEIWDPFNKIKIIV